MTQAVRTRASFTTKGGDAPASGEGLYGNCAVAVSDIKKKLFKTPARNGDAFAPVAPSLSGAGTPHVSCTISYSPILTEPAYPAVRLHPPLLTSSAAHPLCSRTNAVSGPLTTASYTPPHPTPCFDSHNASPCSSCQLEVRIPLSCHGPVYTPGKTCSGSSGRANTFVLPWNQDSCIRGKLKKKQCGATIRMIPTHERIAFGHLCQFLAYKNCHHANCFKRLGE